MVRGGSPFSVGVVSETGFAAINATVKNLWGYPIGNPAADRIVYFFVHAKMATSGATLSVTIGGVTMEQITPDGSNGNLFGAIFKGYIATGDYADYVITSSSGNIVDLSYQTFRVTGTNGTEDADHIESVSTRTTLGITSNHRPDGRTAFIHGILASTTVVWSADVSESTDKNWGGLSQSEASRYYYVGESAILGEVTHSSTAVAGSMLSLSVGSDY